MNGYWVFEYIKVLIAYLLVMYLWPSVVFHRFLRSRGRIFRFGFCALASVLIINTAVLGLGLIHALFRPLVFLLFYGVFFYQLRRYFPPDERLLSGFRRLSSGTLKPRGFLVLLAKIAGDGLKAIGRKMRAVAEGHEAECAVLILLIAYGLLYFGWGPLHMYSYGFTDVYVHHSWIYDLINGRIFSDGIYPEAMHSFVYLISTCFGIRIYSILMFLGPVHIITLLISVFLFVRELLHSRFGPHIAVLLFLILDGDCVDMVYSFARLQCTIPQEFAVYTEFLGACALLRYIRYASAKQVGKGKFSFDLSDDLYLFTFAVAASVSIHFYLTGMMFFLCVAVALFNLFRVLHFRKFVPLACSVLAGVVIAVLPMGLAFAEGIPFQGSINWALHVINPEYNAPGTGDEKTEPEESEAEESASLELYPAAAVYSVSQKPVTIPLISFQEVKEKVYAWLYDLYLFGYIRLYHELRSGIIIRFIGIAFTIGILMHGFYFLLGFLFRNRRKTISPSTFDGYLIIASAGIIFMIMYTAPALSLPELIQSARLCASEQILVCALLAVPFDFVMTILERLAGRIAGEAAGVLSLPALTAAVLSMNLYHGYLYFELTRYNQSVDVTNRIISAFPDMQYTIISITEDIYQVIEYGYHEELLLFLNNVKKDFYTLPTPNLLLFVEKRPLIYDQCLFFSGPDWLGKKKYTEYFVPALGEDHVSRYPEVSGKRISPESASMRTPPLTDGSGAGADPGKRTIMESQANEWLAAFRKYYPHSVDVFYEDDTLACYAITQNPARLTNLALFGEQAP